MSRSRVSGKRHLDLYVSHRGFDGWSGRLARPAGDGSDGPFASLEAARDAIRRLKREDGLPAGGVIVHVTGTFRRWSPFELAAEDSGTPHTPVVYRARAGARLLGGARIPCFSPVTDPAVLRRLAPSARAHIRVADLRACGIRDFGTLQSRGFGRGVVPAGLELFFNGRPMTPARWPNVDFTAITGIVKETSQDDGWGNAIGALESGFYFKNDRIKHWAPSDDIWVHGYWCWDWANTYERVVSIDRETGLVRTAAPHGMYGFRTGQRFFFLNVLEELDQPGEWYLDRARGLLYFWPPSSPEDGDAVVSVTEQPLMVLRDVAHVRVEGITFEAGRGHGLTVEGGHHVTVSGCTLQNLGNHGVMIRGGTDHVVSGCIIRYTGDSGVDLEGGDRKALAPCGHVVENCHIHDFARWSRCYQTAIRAGGIGMRFSHNRLHHAPHTAILFWGNEFTIEHNEIYQVCLETGDAGAIYTGRDYTFRGNVVRGNFIHHMGGVGMGTMGVYNDDCVSGTLMEGNIFYRCTRAAMLGGGRELRVINNLFIDCRPAINFDARGMSEHAVWQRMVNGYMREQAEKMNYLQPPYITRYPELKDVGRYLAEGKGVPPENCLAERNVCVGGQWVVIEWGPRGDWLVQRNNLVVDRGLRFADADRLNFTVKMTPALRRLGFRPIAADAIGLTRGRMGGVPGRELVHAYLEVVRQPEETATGVRPGLCRLIIENRGQAAARGRVRLCVEANGDSAAGSTWMAYRLAAGARVTRALELAAGPGTASKGQSVLRLPDPTGGSVGVCVDDEEYIRHRLAVRVRKSCSLPVLDRVTGADMLGNLLRKAERVPVLVGTETIAEIRLGIAGSDLALHASVRDGRLVQDPVSWKGSCVELFVARAGIADKVQVFLVPAAGGNPGRAALAGTAGDETALPSIRMATTPRVDGYELAALVPLKVLGVSGAREFLFEFQVGTAAAEGGVRQYGTASGARNTGKDPAGFLCARVALQRALSSPSRRRSV